MTNYIKVKLVFNRVDEDGKEIVEKQNVLVDAMSFTEAEAKVTKHMSEYLREGSELALEAMNYPKYHEVFTDKSFEGSIWFEALVKFEHENDKGKIRVEKQKMLIMGDNIQSATENLERAMKGTLMDYTIAGLKETNIAEVFTLGDSLDEEFEA